LRSHIGWGGTLAPKRWTVRFDVLWREERKKPLFKKKKKKKSTITISADNDELKPLEELKKFEVLFHPCRLVLKRKKGL